MLSVVMALSKHGLSNAMMETRPVAMGAAQPVARSTVETTSSMFAKSAMMEIGDLGMGVIVVVELRPVETEELILVRTAMMGTSKMVTDVALSANVKCAAIALLIQVRSVMTEMTEYGMAVFAAKTLSAVMDLDSSKSKRVMTEMRMKQTPVFLPVNEPDAVTVS